MAEPLAESDTMGPGFRGLPVFVMLVASLAFCVPALLVLAFAAYARQGHRLPHRLDPYPRVEAAQERLRPAAERLRPAAERVAAAATRAAPAVDRVKTAVEQTDTRLQHLVGESPRPAPMLRVDGVVASRLAGVAAGSGTAPAYEPSAGSASSASVSAVGAPPGWPAMDVGAPRPSSGRAGPVPPLPALPPRPRARAGGKPRSKVLAKAATRGARAARD